MKRLIDVCVSLTALLVLWPLFALIAVAIKLDSPGPVLFWQDRVGRGRRRFRLVKFRTMRNEPNGGPLVTIADDQRITRVGAFLRKAKADEFPQLFNVLVGDMSLVGPRPEVPKYVELFAKDYEIILGVRPGLTDPASFKYRHEGVLLRRAADPEREYIERILPDKIKLAKAYVAEARLSLDLILVLKTLLEAVGMEAGPIARGAIRHRRPLVVIIHMALVMIAYYSAWHLRFDGHIPAAEMRIFWQFLPWLLIIRANIFAMFRLYQGLWRYTSLSDGVNIAVAVLLSTVSFVTVVRLFYGEMGHPRSVFIIDAILLIGLMSGVRLMRRAYHELSAAGPGRRVLVFGAADVGELTIRELKKRENYRVIGLADDNPLKWGRRIHGVPVLGGRDRLPQILAELKPAEILVAIDQPDPSLLRDLVRLAEPFTVKLTMLPTITQRLEPHVELSQVRNVSVEDLLSRPVVRVNQDAVRGLISGRRIMVTGAGGSIGSELCRQIVGMSPATLMMVDRYENGLHTIRLELERRSSGTRLLPVIADVTDAQRVDGILSRYRPEIVFHAAAHKHVPLMEENPCEAVKNNVGGTRILAEAAEEHGVDRFVLISTDKAVDPTSVMGATKRVAELLIQHMAAGSGTSFSIVRFGNVLGSNGSAIPLFMDQIRAGGPVTVTHPDVRRFFMLIPEAVQLVLHAAAHAQNGATYVLDMGEQVKLVDVARNLIRLSGFVPDQDIKIEFIGLRPGEKLAEELVGPHEQAEPTDAEQVLCVRSTRRSFATLSQSIDALERLAWASDVEAVRSALAELVGRNAEEAAVHASTVSPEVSSGLEPGPEQACPRCHSERIHRSRARSIHERMKKEFTEQRLYRCRDCSWRGWLTPMQFPSEPALPQPVERPSAPDLSSMDRTLRAVPAPGRANFAPRRLS